MESKACDIIQERRLLEIALGCVKGSGQERIKNSPHQGGEKKKTTTKTQQSADNIANQPGDKCLLGLSPAISRPWFLKAENHKEPKPERKGGMTSHAR